MSDLAEIEALFFALVGGSPGAEVVFLNQNLAIRLAAVFRDVHAKPSVPSDKSGRSETRHMDSRSLGQRERHQSRRGTRSSNPASSSGESGTNRRRRTPGAENGTTCTEALAWMGDGRRPLFITLTCGF